MNEHQISLPITPDRSPGGAVVAPITPAVVAARTRALTQVAEGQDPTFTDRARACVLATLAASGEMSGEALVYQCKAQGIVPARDDRAFGPVFHSLARRSQIVQVGDCLRARGHGTAGGRVWALPSWRPRR